MDATRDSVDDLATLLFSLEIDVLTTAAVTAEIAREITGWALRRGWSVRPEVRIMVPRRIGLPTQVGYLDLVLRRGDALADLAIEIDSTDKQWSVAKLRHVVAAGMQGVWVRWGDDQWAGVYDGIDVIQLPALRRTKPRDKQIEQLAMW